MSRLLVTLSDIPRHCELNLCYLLFIVHSFNATFPAIQVILAFQWQQKIKYCTCDIVFTWGKTQFPDAWKTCNSLCSKHHFETDGKFKKQKKPNVLTWAPDCSFIQINNMSNLGLRTYSDHLVSQFNSCKNCPNLSIRISSYVPIITLRLMSSYKNRKARCLSLGTRLLTYPIK